MIALKIAGLYIKDKGEFNAALLFKPQHGKRTTQTSMNPKAIIGKVVGDVMINLVPLFLFVGNFFYPPLKGKNTKKRGIFFSQKIYC